MTDSLSSGLLIKKRLQELGLRAADISRQIKVTKGTVSLWVNDTTKPSGENLIKLCNLLRIEPESFSSGKIIEKSSRDDEAMFMLSKSQSSSVNEDIAEYLAKLELPASLSAKVPLISRVQAGQWSAIVDDFQPGDADMWVNTTAKVGLHAFALKVEGDSMTNPHGLPSIPEGMTVIVDPEIEPTNGKIVVARLESEAEATIKKLVIDGPNKYLMPLNPRYDKIIINGDCTIVGVVVKMEYDLV